MIYMLRIAGQTTGLIGLTFFWHSWVAGGVLRYKNKFEFFFPRTTPGPPSGNGNEKQREMLQPSKT